MTKYTVRAKRWARGWELHIDGIGVTQSRNLKDADAMIRDYLRLDVGEDSAQSAEIAVHVELGGLEGEAEEVSREINELSVMQEKVADRSRRLARNLRAAGLTGADAAEVMHVSPQRLSQLTKV